MRTNPGVRRIGTGLQGIQYTFRLVNYGLYHSTILGLGLCKDPHGLHEGGTCLYIRLSSRSRMGLKPVVGTLNYQVPHAIGLEKGYDFQKAHRKAYKNQSAFCRAKKRGIQCELWPAFLANPKRLDRTTRKPMPILNVSLPSRSADLVSLLVIHICQTA